MYGGNTKTPFSEEDRVDNPVSLYAATKKSNELMAHVYSGLYGIPTTGLRFFPGGSPEKAFAGNSLSWPHSQRDTASRAVSRRR